ncbi:MAG: PAAR domain-containing protein [Azoarcus sp.]|jgi:uncharacterized Zn-binding protein involved in type VI secretion|nr:PAAR domain-containing protein [Azoarcus sp.]
MPNKYRFIVLGDKTTHGGTVISAYGEGRMSLDGVPLACVGDKVSCPKCKGTHTILTGASHTSIDGRPVAIESSRVSDGSFLVPANQWRGTYAHP